MGKQSSIQHLSFCVYTEVVRLVGKRASLNMIGQQRSMAALIGHSNSHSKEEPDVCKPWYFRKDVL